MQARKSVGFAAPVAAEQMLFIGRGLDFTLTTDQELQKVFDGGTCIPTRVYVLGRAGEVVNAWRRFWKLAYHEDRCVGGLHASRCKTGPTIVAGSYAWAGLQARCLLAPPLVPLARVIAATALYLSLITPSAAACTADIFVSGLVID